MAPIEPFQQCRKLTLRRPANADFFAAERMTEYHLHASEQQTVTVELALEETVVYSLAMGGIADNGMTDMLHVATQLVVAAGERNKLNQCIA